MSNDKKDPATGAGGFPFSPQDAMAFMQKMWNPLGVAMPGFAMPGSGATAMPAAMPFPDPATMFAALDPVEIDRKIAEMRIIENWLTMSVSMIQMSVKTMELQKASVEAMRGSMGGSKK